MPEQFLAASNLTMQQAKWKVPNSISDHLNKTHLQKNNPLKKKTPTPTHQHTIKLYNSSQTGWKKMVCLLSFGVGLSQNAKKLIACIAVVHPKKLFEAPSE